MNAWRGRHTDTLRPMDMPAMTAPSPPLPLRIDPAPELLAADHAPLLTEPFASAWASGEPLSPATTGSLRARLMERLNRSKAASATMVTARLRGMVATDLGSGASERLLYAASPGGPLRPGEPLRARLVALAAGGRWSGPAAEAHREWLVLRGTARIGNVVLGLRDYHVQPAGAAPAEVASEGGALLFLRESALAAEPADQPFTVRDAEAGWPDYAPGIRRRVLWQRAGAAALLYHAGPGASVPAHSHGHDEECLMVQGELFLDDVLLQQGDYQLAPAGTGHRITETDTGVVIYAHGDLDLRFDT